MKIWDGMRVRSDKYDFTGVVRGEAQPGYITKRPVLLEVELDHDHNTLKAGDTVRCLTREVRVIGRAR